MGVLIFCVKPSGSFEMWLWICICHVSDVQQPNFLILESLYAMVFSAIYPPALSECAPIMFGSITLSCILRFFELVITALKISLLVTAVHASLRQTPQSKFSSITLLLSMWCTLLAMDSKDPLLLVD